MELKIEQVAIPEKIAFNYDELKQELSDKVKMYETLVYSDEDIKSAKADRADLNRLKKALNDERIRREKEYMQPFNVFKAQINEIIGIIDKPVALIDRQIKEYEENRKCAKKQEIFNYWCGKYEIFEKVFGNQPHILFEKIFDEKWLNASVSMKSIQEQIDARIESINSDLSTLSNLPEFAFEAIETYKSTLDLNKSIAEGHRLSEIQKRKAEQERIKAEQEKAKAEQERLHREQEIEIAKAREEYADAANVGGVHMPGFPYVEPSKTDLSPRDEIPFECTQTIIKEWVSFKAFITVDDAKALKEFFESRNIEFSRI